MGISLKSINKNIVESYVNLEAFYNLIKEEKELNIQFKNYIAYSNYDDKTNIAYVSIFDNSGKESFNVLNMTVIIDNNAKINLIKEIENDDSMNSDVEFLNHFKELDVPTISYSSVFDENDISSEATIKLLMTFFKVVNNL